MTIINNSKDLIKWSDSIHVVLDMSTNLSDYPFYILSDAIHLCPTVWQVFQEV